MKKIEAIIRTERFEEVKEALKGISYPGMTRTLVEGHGQQKGVKQQFRGSTFELEFVPKIKLEIVVLDENVSETIDAIVSAGRTGEIGDGKIFILPVESVVRVRTGERDEKAI